MSVFKIDKDLEVGAVFEVAGGSIKIALQKDISELTRSYGGRVYDVGQIGSILKLHMGRKILLATVRLLRLQTDEEAASLSTASALPHSTPDKRVIEAELLGEASYNAADSKLQFRRGVSTYPLPLQAVHLTTKDEIELIFQSAELSRSQSEGSTVPIGVYVGATKVACRADVDKLFGQHSAILGSTGSGKSSAVASIIHSVLNYAPPGKDTLQPNIILIDPHGEYASAFRSRAQVYCAYDAIGAGAGGASNLSLPYWLMSGDEFRSLLIGKTEFEATSQSNTVYKALAHARMVEAGLAESALVPLPASLPGDQHPEIPIPKAGVSEQQINSFDRDKPRPFRLAEFRAHIEKRQALRWQGGGWVAVTASDFQRDYASILNKFRVLTTDPRIGFMMREYDSSAQSLNAVLKQFIGVNANDPRPLKIIDISGLPNEVAGPLTGAIARLLFQYKLHQTREEREADPVLFVCEEAHRYVPNRGEAQYEVAQSAVRRIAREGRKYGLGLMLVSQRPSDIEGTVLSQCNSWIVLRLSNGSDQEHVARFLPDGLSGMTKLLASLPRQEAIFVGDAAALPARIQLNTLTKEQLPSSNDISFAAGWATEGATEESIANVVGRMQT